MPSSVFSRLSRLALILLSPGGAAWAEDTVDCSRPAGSCPEIEIVGDRAAWTPTFTGFADPSLVADPIGANRFWLAYSYLTGKRATGAAGQLVGVPVVATHLARSDNGGKSWRFVSTLWDSELTADPEGKSRPSYFGSETPSLTFVRNGARTTWYSVRLSYFLEPESAYKPRYGTGWTMRVARAEGPSPASLARGDDAVLGVRTTAAAYGAHVDLNALAPELADCAMWNNPIVTAQSGRLYLVAECLVFRGTEIVAERTRMVVLSTDAAGAPKDWRWRYDGVLADHALAQALGGDQLVSAEIQRGRDGRLLFIATPQTDKVGQGCVVMELESIDPPRVKRDPAGAPLIRARQTSVNDTSSHTGACAYAAGSATGLISVEATTRRGLQARLLATGLKP